MKKLLSILLIVTVLLSTVLVAIPASATTGNETERKLPVPLASGYTPEGTGISALNQMSGDANNKYYLTQDITVTSHLGNFPSGATLDGNGHTVTVNSAKALWNWADGATIKNLILTGSITETAIGNVDGTTQDQKYNAGILSMGLEGTVLLENIYSDVSYTLTGGTVRYLGFMGKNQTSGNATVTYRNVVNAGDFTVNEGARVEDLGGLIGYTTSALNIENCTYSGTIDVNGNSKWVGGFVGNATKSVSITGSTFSGSVSTTATYDNIEPVTGGMIGYAPVTGGSADAPAIKLENNTISGDVEHNEPGRKGHVGGMMGYGGGDNAVIVINNCDSTVDASVSVSSYTNGNHVGVGGLVGTAKGGSTGSSLTMTNCDAKGTVTLTVTGNGNNNVNVNTQVAGVVARVNYMKEATISGCTNSGAVTVVDQIGNNQKIGGGWDGVAGIVGGLMTRSGATDYEIYNCVNTGAVTGHGAAAGILGTNCQMDSADAVIAIHDCLNFGKITEITTSGHAGGIAGSIGGNGTSNFYQFSIKNCVNAGEVVTSTGWCVGGILGQWADNGTSRHETYIATIENCVNAGYVHTTKWAGRAGDPWLCAGGMVGNFMNPLAIKNCVNVGNVSSANTDYFYGGFPISNTVEARTSGDLDILEATGNIYLAGTVGMAESTFTDSTSADKATVYAKIKTLNTYGYSTSALEAERKAYTDSVETDYLPSTWTAYTTAYNSASDVLTAYIQAAPLARYQYSLNDAEVALANAKAALVKKADFYKAITDAIADTESLVADEYTTGSWANLQSAITAANTLMTNNSEDATAVANAAAAITTAQNNLIAAGALGPIYDAQARADALNLNDYTSASWAVVTEKYTAAQDVVDNYSDDLEKIEAAAKALNDAIDALIDVSELKAAINTTIEDEKYYTEDSYADYTTALDAARGALTATTQEDVDTATANLDSAIEALTLKTVSEDVLEEIDTALASADALEEHHYTAETWSKYAEALATVQALSADSTLLESEAALDAFAKASAALVEATASAEDYAALDAVIAAVEELNGDDYIADTWNAVMAKVEAAQALGDAETVKTVEDAKIAIEEAIALLVKLPADGSELDERIDNLSDEGKLALAMASKRHPAKGNMSAIVDALA